MMKWDWVLGRELFRSRWDWSQDLENVGCRIHTQNEDDHDSFPDRYGHVSCYIYLPSSFDILIMACLSMLEIAKLTLND